MEIQQVEVIIQKDGKIMIQVQGATGMSCLEITRDLEEILGTEILSREFTLESGLPPSEIIQDVRQKNKHK